jgi:Ca2+-binding RTX toxin-like protein
MADIFGSTSDDYLEGTEGDDLIVAGTGADTVHGYGGNDVIRFTAEQHGSSADSFLGGTGVDTLEFDFLYNGSFASLELAVGTTIEGWISIDNAKSANVSEIEKITSTFNTFRDHVTLTLGASVSPDIHFAIDGNGVDYFYEDSLVILAQALGTGLTITSSNGVIQSSLGTFTSFEVLTVEGTEFADTFSAAGVLGGGTSLNGHGGNDTLDGSGAADYLFGEAGNDLVHGGGGNDFLGGGAGDDQLYGGEGNDAFLVD